MALLSRPVFICFFIALAFTVQAQTRKKAEARFTEELNKVLKGSSTLHWAYEADRMKVDTPFYISNGILSVTVHYQNDTADYRVRMEAPVNKIKDVAWDMYIILEFARNEVSVFETDAAGQWKKADQRNIFHIGLANDEGKKLEAVTKAFDRLRQYYVE